MVSPRSEIVSQHAEIISPCIEIALHKPIIISPRVEIRLQSLAIVSPNVDMSCRIAKKEEDVRAGRSPALTNVSILPIAGRVTLEAQHA
jgi:hypothetical protein